MKFNSQSTDNQNDNMNNFKEIVEFLTQISEKLIILDNYL
jgi:hypothetical protein